jgi:methyl-accepting chemotaxis protein
VHKLLLSHRLAIGFGVVLALLTSITFTAYQSLSRVNEGLRFITEVYQAKADQSLQMDRALNQSLLAMRNLSLAEAPETELQQLEHLMLALERYDVTKAQLAPSLESAEEKQLFAQVETAEAAARKLIASARQQVDGNDPDKIAFVLRLDLRQNIDKWNGLQSAWSDAIEKLATLESASSQRFSDELQQSAARIQTVLLAVAVAALLTGIGASVLIARSITRPLAASVVIAERIAQGDLSHPQSTHRRDEIGHLLLALESMRGQLHDLALEVKTATDGINSASSEIARGSMDLSKRTEEASSSLEQTSGAMNGLTGQVRDAAETARQAGQLAASASDVAGRGGSVVTQVVSTMEAIASDSSRIASIVNLIDGIAFQTNILALNAAVEAARAGEQGRGFAVVASEVRSLAQRSAQAAKEIKGLIDASTDKVDEGAKLVREAGSTMKEIVDSVRNVTGMISSIDAATEAQNKGIHHVHVALAHLDDMSQQNAALGEECAAAAAALAEQARALAVVVQRFKLAPTLS